MTASELREPVEAASGPLIVALDVGGTKVAAGVVSLPDDGSMPSVSGRRSVPTRAQEGGAALLERMVALAGAVLDECAGRGLAVAGIGIAAAGVPDSRTGRIISATDILPGWAGQDVYGAFRAAYDLPVHMIGDVGAHGLGEAVYGAGRDGGVVLSIGVGTGIGGAIVIGGRLFAGAHGMAGHAGHVASGAGEGFLCSCGTRSGHIEPVASGGGLASLYNATLPEGVRRADDGRDVCLRARRGEAYAVDVLRRGGRALGACVAGMANLIDPDVVVCSGSVVDAGEPWWEGLREGYADGALPLVASVPLRRGSLGGDAPLIGAAHALRTDGVVR